MPLIPAGPDQCDTLLMDFDGCRDMKSALGTAAVIVMDKSDRHRQGDRAHLLFLQARELRPVHAVPRGHGLDVARARPAWPTAGRRSARSTCCSRSRKQIEGHTICAFGDGAAWPVQGLLRHFRPEIERRIDEYTRNAQLPADTSRCRHDALVSDRRVVVSGSDLSVIGSAPARRRRVTGRRVLRRSRRDRCIAYCMAAMARVGILAPIFVCLPLAA